MYRINTTNKREKWKWVCPTPHEHRDWRVVDGLFECRSCGNVFRSLRNVQTGAEVPRDRVEVIGAEADHKGQFGEPTVR